MIDQGKLEEMYHMLVEISSELETIKDTMAKSKIFLLHDYNSAAPTHSRQLATTTTITKNKETNNTLTTTKQPQHIVVFSSQVDILVI